MVQISTITRLALVLFVIHMFVIYTILTCPTTTYFFFFISCMLMLLKYPETRQNKTKIHDDKKSTVANAKCETNLHSDRHADNWQYEFSLPPWSFPDG